MRRHLSTAKTTVPRHTIYPANRRKNLLYDQRLDDLFPIALSRNWLLETEKRDW